MTHRKEAEQVTIGMAQIAPVWLKRDQTLEKILAYATDAAQAGCNLVVFGEGVLPGYPFWLELTHGAEFNSPRQKELHAHYLANAVQIEAGHLDDLCVLARDNQMAVYLGCIERPEDRGGHSVYASLVYIDQHGSIQSVHRKLRPTYEERLAWSPGDGNGLRTHKLGAFTVGGLNCWENWMPLARAALYGMGEDLHIAVWPGNLRNTQDITRFIAFEARSYVVSVSGLMRSTDIPSDTPHYAEIAANAPEMMADGGSCLAGPDGAWLMEPVVGKEGLFVKTIEYNPVREERQNLDPAGHYSRPDVLQLSINRQRQSTIHVVG